MTIKEQLIHEIDRVPESLAEQLLDFLRVLQSPSTSIVETDENPFDLIDGFLIIKHQGSLPDVDWVAISRNERIDELARL